MKQRLLILISGLVCVGAFWGVSDLWPQSSSHSQSVSLLTQLHQLDTLEVLQAEFVNHKTYDSRSYLGLNQNAFVVISRGRAQYGLPMSQVQIQDTDQALVVTLPKIALLRVYMVPGSLEYVGLHKGWFTTQNTFETLKTEALRSLEKSLEQQARDLPTEKSAEANAKALLTQLLRHSGVKKEIIFRFGADFRPH